MGRACRALRTARSHDKLGPVGRALSAMAANALRRAALRGAHESRSMRNPSVHFSIAGLDWRLHGRPSWQCQLIVLCAVGAGYYLAGRWALHLVRDHGGVAMFWPASGIAAGAAVVLSRSMYLPIALGVIGATVIVNLEEGAGALLAAAFSFANALECLLFGWLMGRLGPSEEGLERLGGVAAFFAAGVGATAVAAVPAALALHLLGPSQTPLASIWLTWLKSDGLGIAVLAPLLITAPSFLAGRHRRSTLLEGVVAAVLAAIVAHYAFQAVFSVSMSPVTPTTLLFPIFLWLAGRTPALFSAASAFMVSIAIIVTALAAGEGPGYARLLNDRLESAQVAVLTTMVAAMTLAAMFARLKNTAAALHSSEQRLQLALAAGQMYAFELDVRAGLAHRAGGLIKKIGLAENGTLEEFIGVLHPDDRASFHDLLMSLSPAEPTIIRQIRMATVGGAMLSVDYRSQAEFDAAGNLIRVRGVCVDNTERDQARAALEQREEELRGALVAGRAFAFEYDLLKREVRRTDNAAEVLGLPLDVVRRSSNVFLEHVHKEDRAALKIYPLHLSIDQPFTSQTFRFVRPDGGIVWLDMTSTGVFADDGRLVKVRGLTFDVTARVKAEQQREALIEELDHRVKNALARMAVVIDLSREGHLSIDDYYAVIRGRIGSMAKTQERLSRNKWSGVDIAVLVADEIEAYRQKGNCSIEGPSLVLEPDTAQSYAFTLHELATNAAKHGALATPNGNVSVDWSIEGEGTAARRLVLRWREDAGRPIEAPSKESYGLGTIRNLLRYEKGATIDLAFRPTGLACTISLPLPPFSAPAPAEGAAGPATTSPRPSARAVGPAPR